MSNLIPVFNGQIQQEQTQLVDARILHKFLKVEVRFNDWINRRISEYEFIENQDFIIFTQKRVKMQRGRPTVDYHITLDMAKELSMIERTEKGRQARKYFIECEKQLIKMLSPTQSKIGLTPAHQRHIQKRVSELAHVTGNSYPAVYRSIKDRFNVGTYKDVSEDQYLALCEFLGCEPLEGEYIEHTSKRPEPPENFPEVEEDKVAVDIQALRNLINNFLWIDDTFKTFRLLDAITMLGGFELAGRLRGRINDSHLAIRLMRANKSLISPCNPC